MVSRDWVNKQYLLAWIFDVGRGSCAFVRTPSKDGVLIDCGGDEKIVCCVKEHLVPICRRCAGTEGKKNRIGQVIISHPHVDHFRSIEEAVKLNPMLWTCPHDKEPKLLEPDERLNWELIENPEDSDELLELYRNAYEGRRLPLQVFAPAHAVPHFAYGIFYIRPLECEPIENFLGEDEGLPEKDYANNTSIMVCFRFNRSSILFPGDMMASGMKRALEVGCENRRVGEGVPEKYRLESGSAQILRKWVNSGCSVLVAPHHGLESGYSPEFFRSLPTEDPRVGLVVISEKAKPRKGEGKVHTNYQSEEKVKGATVIDEYSSKSDRLSVTTRTDGNCLVGFRGTDDLSVVVSHDLEWILTDGPEALFA